MGKWWKSAVGAALVIGAGAAALAWTGVWPGPSAADRQQARAYFVQAEVQIQAGDQWDPLESTCRHASLSIL